VVSTGSSSGKQAGRVPQATGSGEVCSVEEPPRRQRGEVGESCAAVLKALGYLKSARLTYRIGSAMPA